MKMVTVLTALVLTLVSLSHAGHHEKGEAKAKTVVGSYITETGETNPLYAGDIPNDKAVDIISAANGVFGACADYFTKTTQSLRNLGLNDSRLEEIVRLIQQRTTKK